MPITQFQSLCPARHCQYSLMFYNHFILPLILLSTMMSFCLKFARSHNWTEVLMLHNVVMYWRKFLCSWHLVVVKLKQCYVTYFFSRELQWQQLSALYENLCIKPADGQCDQLLYISLVCFMRSLYHYASAIESPPTGAGKCAVVIIVNTAV